jgi:hypothetical protein
MYISELASVCFVKGGRRENITNFLGFLGKTRAGAENGARVRILEIDGEREMTSERRSTKSNPLRQTEEEASDPLSTF